MKQIFPKLVMTVAMLLSFLPASAYDFEVDGFFYNVIDATHKVEVTYKDWKYETYSGDINIPATVTYGGTTYSVISIGPAAFRYCRDITSITIPNSVTHIGTKAFESCWALTSVTIPNLVANIGYQAFDNCPLKSIYCNWKEPIESYSDVFSSDCYKNGTLYVPKGCAGKYCLISPWSYFVNIEESDNLGIEDIIEDNPADGYIVYDIQGVLRLKTENIDEVNQLPAGLYIVNGKKILIR